jgi:hypothetical protein
VYYFDIYFRDFKTELFNVKYLQNAMVYSIQFYLIQFVSIIFSKVDARDYAISLTPPLFLEVRGYVNVCKGYRFCLFLRFV